MENKYLTLREANSSNTDKSSFRKKLLGFGVPILAAGVTAGLLWYNQGNNLPKKSFPENNLVTTKILNENHNIQKAPIRVIRSKKSKTQSKVLDPVKKNTSHHISKQKYQLQPEQKDHPKVVSSPYTNPKHDNLKSRLELPYNSLFSGLEKQTILYEGFQNHKFKRFENKDIIKANLQGGLEKCIQTNGIYEISPNVPIIGENTYIVPKVKGKVPTFRVTNKSKHYLKDLKEFKDEINNPKYDLAKLKKDKEGFFDSDGSLVGSNVETLYTIPIVEISTEKNFKNKGHKIELEKFKSNSNYVVFETENFYTITPAQSVNYKNNAQKITVKYLVPTMTVASTAGLFTGLLGKASSYLKIGGPLDGFNNGFGGGAGGAGGGGSSGGAGGPSGGNGGSGEGGGH